MKKYHLADACTALECVSAFIIIGMIVAHAAPEYALCAFFVGEICDAIDGPLARRFHYPDDGKYRWWRAHAGLIDQLSDLLLGIVTSAYITLCVNYAVGATIIISASIIGIAVQNLAYKFPPLKLNWLETRPRLGTRLVLVRRWLYVALIVFAVALLLWMTSWPLTAKITITIIFIAIGLFLLVCKLNRLTEVKTKL